MPGAFVSLRGTLALQTSNNTGPSFNTSGAISAGNKAIIVGACDKEVLSGVSGGGLTWTVVRHQGHGVGPGVGGTNVACFVAYADCPTGLASGTSIVLQFTGTGVNRVTASLEEWSGLATGMPVANRIVSAQGTSATPDSGLTTDPAVLGDACIGVVGWGANVATGTWTQPGGYTKTDHQAIGAVTPISEWAVHRSNVGSQQRMNPSTTNGSNRWTSIMVIFPLAVVVSPGFAGVHLPQTPYVVTEIAFASNPGDAVPVWTDVSQYVKEIHTKLGRSNPLEDIDAGTCQYILDNRDRRFEPLYSGGAYYPNVIPLKRIRSYTMENPLIDSGFEDRNALGAWQVNGGGSISVPAYGTSPAAKFRDWKMQATLGAGPTTYGGIAQFGAVFNKMPVAGEYVGVSIYVYATKAGAVQVVCQNQAGTQFAFTTSDCAPNAWTRIASYGVVPAGTTSFGIIANAVSGGTAAWAAGDLVHFDGAQIHAFRTTNVNFVPSLGSAFDRAAPYTETVYLFDGFIEGWPQIWAGGMQADVGVTAVDGFKPLAPMQAPRGYYDLVVMDDLPTWYFRLGESLNTLAAQNEVASGIQDGAYLVSGTYPQMGQAGAITGDYDTAAKFGNPSTPAGTSDVHKTAVVIPTFKFALETWCKWDSPTAPGNSPDNNADYFAMFCHGDDSDAFGNVILWGWNYLTTGAGALYTGVHPFIQINYGNAWGSIRIYIKNPAGTAAYWASYHHFCISFDGTGADGKAGWPRAYLDGVEIDLSSAANQTYSSACNVAAGTTANVSKAYLGKISHAGLSRKMFIGNDYTGIFGLRNVTLDEFAYWVNSIPTDGWASRHYTALSYGGPVEDSGARAARILDLATVAGNNPWPAVRRQIDVGVSQVLGWRWNEEKLVELIKQDAKSEGGIFFFRQDGKAVFQNRWHTIQYPYSNPKGTLTDAPDATTPPYQDIGSGGLDYDDQDIYNDVSIARFKAGYGDASGLQSVADATSQQKYLIRSLTLDDSIVTTDTEALNAANWYLRMFKEPGLKARNLQIEPLDQPENLMRVISWTTLNDRLSVVRHPPPGSGTLSFEVLVMGIQHDFMPGEWHVNYSVYPGPTRDFWQLPDATTNDEYAQYSVLGTTTRLAY